MGCRSEEKLREERGVRTQMWAGGLLVGDFFYLTSMGCVDETTLVSFLFFMLFIYFL
jgi:hypothetical protein